MTYEEKLLFVIEDHIAFIMCDPHGEELLSEYLRSGFKGFGSYTEAELDAEMGAILNKADVA